MDRDELISRSAALAPTLLERAARTEELRSVPPETVDDLRRAGLLRATLPERFGGMGFDYDLILDVGAELGRGCGSTAWCYGVWASDAWLIGMYPEQAQEEFWADGPDTLCASCLNPAGASRITPVDGGCELAGHWDFASGCDAADWALILGAGPDGALSFLVPRSDFTIDDTWFASGLRGSGSKDVIVEGAFVPAHRVLAVTDMQEARTPGRDLHDSANYRVPLFSASSYALAAPMVGMAQGAFEVCRSYLEKRASAPRGRQVSQLAGVQMRLAEAATEIWTARLIMRQDMEEILGRAKRNETPILEQRLRARRNQAYVAALCVRAVNRLFEESGGHALLDASPLQRFHRDIHAAAHHVSLSWNTASEQYGRALLGLEPTNPRY